MDVSPNSVLAPRDGSQSTPRGAWVALIATWLVLVGCAGPVGLATFLWPHLAATRSQNKRKTWTGSVDSCCQGTGGTLRKKGVNWVSPWEMFAECATATGVPTTSLWSRDSHPRLRSRLSLRASPSSGRRACDEIPCQEAWPCPAPARQESASGPDATCALQHCDSCERSACLTRSSGHPTWGRKPSPEITAR